MNTQEEEKPNTPANEEDKPSQPETPVAKAKSKRGFASMDRAKVSEIARKGGQASHRAGTAHEFTSEEARVAGQKGGKATHAKKRATT